MFRLIWISILFSSLGAQASCLSDFIVETENKTHLLEKKYRSFDKSHDSIAMVNRPQILKGSKREVVFLVHGFMGSPFEMADIAAKLNAEGYTTYTGLIPGFGATAPIANQYTHLQWSQWYSQEIRRLETCFPKVHLIGFSTGGLLATEYVENNIQDSAIQSVTLLSPFYKIHSAFYGVLHSGVQVIFDQISVDFVYNVLQFADVGVMVKKRDAYLQDVPLKAAENVVELGEKIHHSKTQCTTIPALVFISADDLVLDQNSADEVTGKLFPNRQWVFRDSQHLESRVPHHLMSRWVSPVYRSTENKIVEFFRSL